MNPPDGLAQVNFVALIHKRCETGFIGTVVHDKQIGMPITQFLSPVRLIERSGQDGNGRAIQTQAVVDHSWSGVLRRDTEKSNATLLDMDRQVGGGEFGAKRRETGRF